MIDCYADVDLVVAQAVDFLADEDVGVLACD